MFGGIGGISIESIFRFLNCHLGGEAHGDTMDWIGDSGAIINLSVQVSHRHRNSWKAHILPQKVYKSANWNESSVEWTLVDLDFAFVMISNFEVVPQPRK